MNEKLPIDPEVSVRASEPTVHDVTALPMQPESQEGDSAMGESQLPIDATSIVAGVHRGSKLARTVPRKLLGRTRPNKLFKAPSWRGGSIQPGQKKSPLRHIK
jgi:hypothetical protein